MGRMAELYADLQTALRLKEIDDERVCALVSHAVYRDPLLDTDSTRRDSVAGHNPRHQEEEEDPQ